MAHHASPESDTDRIYVCSHCPKRYARKDYLERHELNRESTNAWEGGLGRPGYDSRSSHGVMTAVTDGKSRPTLGTVKREAHYGLCGK